MVPGRGPHASGVPVLRQIADRDRVADSLRVLEHFRMEAGRRRPDDEADASRPHRFRPPPPPGIIFQVMVL
jgi:hypothetical protein